MNWRSWARATVSGLWRIIRFALDFIFPGFDLRSREERERAAAEEAATAAAARARVDAMWVTHRELAELEARREGGSLLDVEYIADRDALLATLPRSRRRSPLHEPGPWFVVLGLMLVAYVVAIAIVGHVVLMFAAPNGVSTETWVVTVVGAAASGLIAFAAGGQARHARRQLFARRCPDPRLGRGLWVRPTFEEVARRCSGSVGRH